MRLFYKIGYLPFILFLVVTVLAGKVEAQVNIEGVRVNHLPEKQQVVIDVENKANFYAFALESPPRIVVDVEVERPTAFSPRVSLDTSRVIQKLRTGIRSATTVRLVIDLQEPVRWEAYTMTPDNRRGHRIVIDVFNKVSSFDSGMFVDQQAQSIRKAPTLTVDSPSAVDKALKSSFQTVIKAEVQPSFSPVEKTEVEPLGKKQGNHEKNTEKNSLFSRVTGFFKRTGDTGDKDGQLQLPSQASDIADDELGLPINLPTNNQLYRFRVNRQTEKMQFVLDLQLAPTFQAFELENPKRIVVDVAAKTENPYQDFVGSATYRGVQQIRSGRRSDSVRRLVFDLADSYHWAVSRLLPDNQRGHRLVIDIYDQTAPAITKRFATDDKETSEQVLRVSEPEEIADKPTGIEVPLQTEVSDPALLTEVVEIDLATDDEGLIAPELITVLIDPGHGGRDSGAIGVAGTMEKEVTLDIAKRIKQKLDDVYGMRVILTRYQDEYLSLPRRTQIARQYKADLFVSIHADAFIQPEVSGSSAYVLSEEGSSETAKFLAETENAVDETYGIGIEKYDDIGQVLFDIQQDATIESSYLVAKAILRSLKTVGKLHKRQVERANFSVLRSPGIPSVLVETAFISNPDEEQKLRRVRYREKVAGALADGIQQYFKDHLPHHFELINGVLKDYPEVDH